MDAVLIHTSDDNERSGVMARVEGFDCLTMFGTSLRHIDRNVIVIILRLFAESTHSQVTCPLQGGQYIAGTLMFIRATVQTAAKPIHSGRL